MQTCGQTSFDTGRWCHPRAIAADLARRCCCNWKGVTWSLSVGIRGPPSANSTVLCADVAPHVSCASYVPRHRLLQPRSCFSSLLDCSSLFGLKGLWCPRESCRSGSTSHWIAQTWSCVGECPVPILHTLLRLKMTPHPDRSWPHLSTAITSSSRVPSQPTHSIWALPRRFRPLWSDFIICPVPCRELIKSAPLVLNLNTEADSTELADFGVPWCSCYFCFP